MLNNSKLRTVLGFIVIMVIVCFLFFVEVPETNADIIKTLGTAYINNSQVK